MKKILTEQISILLKNSTTVIWLLFMYSAGKEKTTSSVNHLQMERKKKFNGILLVKKGDIKKTWVRSCVKNGCDVIVCYKAKKNCTTHKMRSN